MDHAFDAMGDAGSICGEEARVEAADAAGRGDRARDQEQVGRIGQQARFRERLPGAVEFYGFFNLAAEAETGFLAGFADRGDRERPRAGRCDLRATLEQVGFELSGNRRGNRNAVVRLVDAAAGKNIFARHEHHFVVALADQNLRLVAGAVDQDQRGCILGPEIGMVIGFFSFLYGSRDVVHPIPIFGALVVPALAIAFSSEVDTGSREGNASKQESRASVLIQSEPKL